MAVNAVNWHIREAARHIRTGGLVAYPTEAVYGLGCDPLNPQALTRLLDLKQRPVSKGVILIASDLQQLAPYIALLAPAALRLLQSTWPGPVTWVVPARPDTPAWLTGGRDTLAMRVTAHPLAAALCRAVRHPIVSTSANPSGLRPARSALAVRRYFPDLDYILAGATGGLDRPTPIRDLRTGLTLRSA